MQGYAAADALADIAAACRRCAGGPRPMAGSAPSATAWAAGSPTWRRQRPTSTPRWPTTAAASRRHSSARRASRCPLQFHYAEHDDNIPPEAVQRVRQATAGKAAEVHVYPGAMHGFNCWARSSYHAPSAALAHGRTLAFLATHLMDTA